MAVKYAFAIHNN